MTNLTNDFCSHCGKDLNGCEGVEYEYVGLCTSPVLLCAQCAEDLIEETKRAMLGTSRLAELHAALFLELKNLEGVIPTSKEFRASMTKVIDEFKEEFSDVIPMINEVYTYMRLLEGFAKEE
jgi:hypothetical protein